MLPSLWLSVCICLTFLNNLLKFFVRPRLNNLCVINTKLVHFINIICVFHYYNWILFVSSSYYGIILVWLIFTFFSMGNEYLYLSSVCLLSSVIVVSFCKSYQTYCFISHDTISIIVIFIWSTPSIFIKFEWRSSLLVDKLCFKPLLRRCISHSINVIVS